MDIIQLKEFIGDRLGFYPNDMKLPDTGVISRFTDLRNSKKNTNCWIYSIASDVYSFGSWSSGDKHTYFENEDNGSMSDEDKNKRRIAIKESLNKINKEKIEYQKVLSKSINEFYDSLDDATEHQYLTDKKIKPFGNVKIYKGMLVIPIYSSISGDIQSIQYITSDGSKIFAKGASIANGCITINKPNFTCNDEEKTIIIAEGYSTACSVYMFMKKVKTKEELDNVLVISCFNCNNIDSVVRNLRHTYGRFVEIIIYADNDKSGIGEKKAREAASNTSNVTINLCPLTQEEKDLGYTDYNDLVNSRKLLD